jgi:hypothetical protein
MSAAVDVDCTFEATDFWSRTLREEFGLRSRVVALGDYEVTLFTHPLHRGAISTPFRDRIALRWSGVPPRLDPAHVQSRAGVDRLLLKDVGPWLQSPDAPTGGELVQHLTNTDVRLDASLESRMEHAARKNIRRAREVHGIELEVNESGAFEQFWRLYLDTRQRLGVLPYPASLFRRLFDRSGGETAIFGARRGREPLGFLIVYLHGTEMISAHLAYDFGQRSLRITDFLFASAFAWGRDRGILRYRFGADNNNQESLIRSKLKFGAEARPQFDWARGVTVRVDDDPSNTLRRVLRSAPGPAFAWSSRLTRLYFA